MKLIVQLQNDLQDNQNKIITRSEVIYDSENFKTSIVEVEDVEVTEGKQRAFVWDKDTQKVKAILEDIPKTEYEVMLARVEAQAKAFEEFVEMGAE